MVFIYLIDSFIIQKVIKFKKNDQIENMIKLKKMIKLIK